jgi:hypothetical protein
MIPPRHGTKDFFPAGGAFLGRQFYHDVIHVMRADAPVAKGGALEGAVDEQVLQHFQAVIARLQL